MLHIIDQPKRPVSALPSIPPEKPKRYYMPLSWSLNDVSVKEKQLLEFFERNEGLLLKKRKYKSKVLSQTETIEKDIKNISGLNKFKNMSATTKRNIWRGIPFYGSDSTTSNSGESTCRTTTDSSMCSCSTSPYSSISFQHKNSFFNIRNPFTQNKKNKQLQRSNILTNTYSDASYKSVNNLNYNYDKNFLRSRDFSLPEKDGYERKRSRSKGIESRIFHPLKSSARKISNALHLRTSKKSLEHIPQGSSIQLHKNPNYSNSILEVGCSGDELNYYSNPNSPLPQYNNLMNNNKILRFDKNIQQNETCDDYDETNPYSEEFIKKELKKNLEKQKGLVRRKSCDPILYNKPFDNYVNNDFRKRMIA
uniref:Uncharacterized protein n=1 Tax=Parastrongyloides trichosuri TaxID=131310 RepID=A0A0N4ZNC8_PARTI